MRPGLYETEIGEFTVSAHLDCYGDWIDHKAIFIPTGTECELGDVFDDLDGITYCVPTEEQIEERIFKKNTDSY